jgi:hypothetical protein
MATERIISPIGEGHWAKVLGEPAPGFDETTGRAWTIELRLQESDPIAQAFLAKLTDIFVEFHGSSKVSPHGYPWGVVNNPDSKGSDWLTFKAKRKEFTARGAEKSGPNVVDSAGEKLDPTLAIGNGSKVRIQVMPWKWGGGRSPAGMSLELVGVQVLELVEFTKTESKFPSVEGGYRAEPPAKDSEDMPF